MLSVHLLCFHRHPPLSLSQKLEFKERRFIPNPNPNASSSSCGFRVHAVKEDSQQYEYEVDPDKAREALQKLDQQLLSLSTKQVSSPKLRASEVKFTKEDARVNMREKEVEISGSFLAYTASALVLFTIFYNFLFYTVIAPSIDGP